tara:strand:+ start:256 stop:1320 length:1065 start_codon:yes stop_codon:yes gene_type:complete
MPCTKCDNGKWKWGENGECKYTSKDACEKANPKHYESLKTTKIVELLISDESQELTIDAISLVTSPAIEQNFVFFGKEKNNLTFAKIDEEKRMLVSPALIPNKQILRHDPNTDSDYYVYFSKDTVQRASELYLEHNNHHKATYQHEERVSGVLTVESWIIEDTKTDKSTLYGFSLPQGTWMVKLKISNNEIWEKIKEGELKGLSIEGYFTNKFEQMQKKQPTNEEVKTALKELLSVQKVELGGVDDLESAIEKLSNLRDSAYGLNKDVLTLQQNIKPLLKEKEEYIAGLKDSSFVDKAETNIKKAFNALAQQASELGISVNKLPVYKKYEASKNLLKEIDGFYKDAKSILSKLD